MNKKQLREAEDLARRLGISMEDALVQLGYISAAEISQLHETQYGFENLDLETIDIPAYVIALVPESFARGNSLIPVSIADERLRIAIHNPFDLLAIEFLRRMTGLEIDPIVARGKAISDAIDRFYGDGQGH